jgi:hypothetical protein
MSVKKSYTTVLERNRRWTDIFATEPWEAAWASEAIFFVRALKVEDDLQDAVARIQISPDGIWWCDEGSQFTLPAQENAVAFGRVAHFGGWLRIVGQIPPGAAVTVITYLVLKE